MTAGFVLLLLIRFLLILVLGPFLHSEWLLDKSRLAARNVIRVCKTISIMDFEDLSDSRKG